jgi:hypothetical protein
LWEGMIHDCRCDAHRTGERSYQQEGSVPPVRQPYVITTIPCGFTFHPVRFVDFVDDDAQKERSSGMEVGQVPPLCSLGNWNRTSRGETCLVCSPSVFSMSYFAPGKWGNSTFCTFESLRDTELETTHNIGGAKKLLMPRQA